MHLCWAGALSTLKLMLFGLWADLLKENAIMLFEETPLLKADTEVV